ncbi:hypothetical protein ABFX02_08G036400 [Erythranthe guttata]
MLKVENTTGAGDAGNNWLSSSRRDRVWMCDACDLAPAAFLCKADSASLCAACDSDIHSANPLARRHIRVPISSAAGNFYGHSAPGLSMGAPEAHSENDFLTHHDGEDEDEAASWLLLNPVKNEDNQSSHDNAPPLFGSGGAAAAVDAYLDLDDYNSCQNNQFNDHHHYNNNVNHHPKLHYSSVPHEKISYGGQDSVVPIQIQEHCFPVGLDYESSHTGYSYPTSMSSHNNVCLSPVMDVGVVPESTMSEGSIISGQYQRTPKGTIDLFSGPLIQASAAPPPAQQLSPVDREARVMRYREKKKMRKFEKTIRYASRKAYAETRPRVKGRFAKRSVSCAS